MDVRASLFLSMIIQLVKLSQIQTSKANLNLKFKLQLENQTSNLNLASAQAHNRLPDPTLETKLDQQLQAGTANLILAHL